jgi:hypothetical protein
MKCFICDSALDTPYLEHPAEHRIICPECCMYAFKHNKLYYDTNSENVWKAQHYVSWYYRDGYATQLDRAKAAYKPAILSDNKCPECKIPMPHTKIDGICIKCSTEKMLSE